MTDYYSQYFTTVALEDCMFSFHGTREDNVLHYSTDGGKTWSENKRNVCVLAKNRDKVLWKGLLSPTSVHGSGHFCSAEKFEVEGNIMSLLYGDDFQGQTDLNGNAFVFSELFLNSNLVNAENLVLPATTLASYCYCSMFKSCRNLMKAPSVLPATTLAPSCYNTMFCECTSLTEAPELPATTLADYCYAWMFSRCSSLTSTQDVLLARTLPPHCYEGMYYECTSLEKAPKLMCEKLLKACCNFMFVGCSSLKKTKLLFIDKQDVTNIQSMYGNCPLIKYNPIIVKE